MFVLLHDYPELLDAVCDLLNAEWPRSRSARLNSLSGSSDSLPLSVLLVSNLTSKSCEVMGHAKVTKLPNDHESCWIESVLIHPNCRGKGLGKELMFFCEDIARGKGFKTVYLSTHDKQGFYSSLGYKFCSPINRFAGVPIFPLEQPKIEYTSHAPQLDVSQSERTELSGATPSRQPVPSLKKGGSQLGFALPTIKPAEPSGAVPVPPPLPVQKNYCVKFTPSAKRVEKVEGNLLNKMYMKKSLVQDSSK